MRCFLVAARSMFRFSNIILKSEKSVFCWADVPFRFSRPQQLTIVRVHEERHASTHPSGRVDFVTASEALCFADSVRFWRKAEVFRKQIFYRIMLKLIVDFFPRQFNAMEQNNSSLFLLVECAYFHDTLFHFDTSFTGKRNSNGIWAWERVSSLGRINDKGELLASSWQIQADWAV